MKMLFNTKASCDRRMIVYAKASQSGGTSKPAYLDPRLQDMPPVRRSSVDRLSHEPTGHHLERHLPVNHQGSAMPEPLLSSVSLSVSSRGRRKLGITTW